MRDHSFELRRHIWRHDRSSQLCTQLNQRWNKSLKKNSGLNGERNEDRSEMMIIIIITWKTLHHIFPSFTTALLTCVCICDNHLCFHIYLRSSNIWAFIYIHLYASPSTGIVWTNNVTRWLDSSVGRALLRKDHGFESRSDLNFFQAFIWVKFLRMKQYAVLETSTSSLSSNISPSKWISSCFWIKTQVRHFKSWREMYPSGNGTR